jgi:serine/threonine protein kinase
MKVMNKQDISMMLKSKKKAYEMLNEELVILKKMVSRSLLA